MERVAETTETAVEKRGRDLGGDIIQGIGQFRCGRGAIVTDWHDTAEAAWTDFCSAVQIAGLENN